MNEVSSQEPTLVHEEVIPDPPLGQAAVSADEAKALKARLLRSETLEETTVGALAERWNRSEEEISKAISEIRADRVLESSERGSSNLRTVLIYLVLAMTAVVGALGWRNYLAIARGHVRPERVRSSDLPPRPLRVRELAFVTNPPPSELRLSVTGYGTRYELPARPSKPAKSMRDLEERLLEALVVLMGKAVPEDLQARVLDLEAGRQGPPRDQLYEDRTFILEIGSSSRNLVLPESVEGKSAAELDTMLREVLMPIVQEYVQQDASIPMTSPPSASGAIQFPPAGYRLIVEGRRTTTVDGVLRLVPPSKEDGLDGALLASLRSALDSDNRPIPGYRRQRAEIEASIPKPKTVKLTLEASGIPFEATLPYGATDAQLKDFIRKARKTFPGDW